jgi:hypothetical protein
VRLLSGLVLLAYGCAEEAVIVELRTEATRGHVCLAAFGAGMQVFERKYEADGAPIAGTLTFVSGSEVADELTVAARHFVGPNERAHASGTAEFSESDSDRLVLELARCQVRTATSSELSEERVQADGAPFDSMALADVDGDGRDELLAVSRSETRAVDLETGGSRVIRDEGEPILARGDLDERCGFDVAYGGPTAAVVQRPSGEPIASVASTAFAVALGRFRTASEAAFALGDRIELVGPSGTRSLARAATSLAATDLDGDGRDELLSAGLDGMRVHRSSEASFDEVLGALPPSAAAFVGPLATGDLDGDGTVDAVASSATEIAVLVNRGDGLLERRAPAVAIDGARRIAVADLTGDCLDDVAALDSGGAVRVFASDGLGGLAIVSTTGELARDLAAGDIDGDGAPELVSISIDGDPGVWRP